MTLQKRIEISTAPEPYRFTQRDYLLLDQSGAFDAYKKTELIEGVIVAANAQYARHARAQANVFRALANACDAIESGPQAWFEVSVDVSDLNMPQPDILVTDSLPEEGAIPLAAVRMVIEVADTSLRTDLTVKTPLYAAANIPEYWVVDVNARVIHQMWRPVGATYADQREIAFGERIAAATIDRLAVETASL